MLNDYHDQVTLSSAQLFRVCWAHEHIQPGTGPRWLSADEQCTWRDSSTAWQWLFAAVDGQLQRDAGMPLAYYEILVRLSEAPDRSLRMTQLAEASASSKSRVSHAVARLEERGWVRRTDCPTDRRGQIAQLTDEGFAALSAAAPGMSSRSAGSCSTRSPRSSSGSWPGSATRSWPGGRSPRGRGRLPAPT